MTCKICMLWEPRGHPRGEDWGTCRKMASTDAYPRVMFTRAYAEDAESYSAWVSVRFNFKCNMYKKGIPK